MSILRFVLAGFAFAVAMQNSTEEFVYFVTGQTRKRRPIKLIPVLKTFLLDE